VDDIERAVKNLISMVKEQKDGTVKLLEDYDNEANLKEVINEIAERLQDEDLYENKDLPSR
jgi:phosphopantothenate synthetase